jgi:membrane fusion protein (multidrug efflux system)
MGRIGRRRIWIPLIIAVIVVVAGGYFARQRMTRSGTADAADTTAVAGAAADTSKAGAKQEAGDQKGKKKGKKEKKEPDPVPVEVATAMPREISTYYYTTATLDPERSVSVLAKAAGQVVSLGAEEGARVSDGTVLCRIDDREAQINLDEARINLEKQDREFDRISKMYDEKLISDREYSDARYQHDVANNQYDAAILRHEYTKVTAPFSGVVTRRYVELGQNVAIGTQLFEIADVEPLLVRMYMPEGEIRGVRVGQEISIEPDNQPGKRLTGRVVRVAPEVDERTGTVKVTAETDGGAMPGSFARVRLVTDTRSGTLSVPRRGLLSDAGEFFVYVAEADSVRKAAVRVGYQNEEYAEIMGGVEEGDSIVVIGAGALRTGTKIKILEPAMQQELSETDPDVKDQKAEGRPQ